MYQTGVYFGRFLPPHRGHLYQIIEASTKCQNLIVVISDNAEQTRALCEADGLPEISYRLRKQWFSQQVQDMPHIQVRVLDESDIPVYPEGWQEWSKRMREVVCAPIDAFFVGDLSYSETLASYFPEAKVELFDPSRTRYPISATEIRKNILGNWHYILGAARPFFAKKVLIAGTESCGKTTLTKCLAKLYNTSWSEEVGPGLSGQRRDHLHRRGLRTHCAHSVRAGLPRPAFGQQGLLLRHRRHLHRLFQRTVYGPPQRAGGEVH